MGSGEKNRSQNRRSIMRLLVSIALVIPIAAQTPKTYSPPRMSDGHPDLQGIYDLATLTPLERQAGAKAVLTKEEAAKFEAAAAQQRSRGDQAIQGDRKAPPKGGDGSTG